MVALVVDSYIPETEIVALLSPGISEGTHLLTEAHYLLPGVDAELSASVD